MHFLIFSFIEYFSQEKSQRNKKIVYSGFAPPTRYSLMAILCPDRRHGNGINTMNSHPQYAFGSPEEVLKSAVNHAYDQAKRWSGAVVGLKPGSARVLSLSDTKAAGS
jgi:hypothetical protein